MRVQILTALLFLAFGKRVMPIDFLPNSANFVCQTEKKIQLNRLAVFTFTDKDGVETDESEEQSTIMLSWLAYNCYDVVLIDKSRETEILNEIALSQTGIVDEKTMLRPDFQGTQRKPERGCA